VDWSMRYGYVKYISIIFGILSSLTTFTQSVSAIKNAYHRSATYVVLVKNVSDQLPIKNLEHCRPTYLKAHFNLDDQYLWLRKYQFIQLHTFESLHQKLMPANSNLLVLDIDLDKIKKNDLYTISMQMDGQPIPYILIIHHVTSGNLPANVFKYAKSIILTTEYSIYNSIHIAQKIYGAEESTSTLPYFVNNQYHSGMGLVTKSLGRLQYGPPELTGINGEMFKEALRLEINDAINQEVFPGANLLVAKDNMVIFHESFGRKKYQSNEKLEKDDLYDLASITKIFAATLGGMKLHSLGLFNPEKTLGSYWTFLRKSNKSKLIWQDVLAHRGRLPASITYYRNVLHKDNSFKKHSLQKKYNHEFIHPVSDSFYASRRVPKKLLTEIKNTKLLPQANYVYSDLSMILLGKTIEEITNQSLSEFLKTNFYKSLGADETLFLPLNEFTKARVVPTEFDAVFRKDLVQGYVHDENAALLGGVSGHAGLFSNANDMAKLAQMLLNKGSYGGKEYLKPETVHLFTKYQYPEFENRRGLGFDKPLLKYNINQAHTARDASADSYGHSGFTGTFIWIDPKYNLTYILLTNRVHPTRANNKISQFSIRPCIQQTIYDHVIQAESN
jgi:beta-N-acetylhexosaminidase